MKFYIVYAYRWGWLNNSGAIIGGWLEQDIAEAKADQYTNDRGGKYGSAVYEIDGEDSELVYYTSSVYGEKKPHVNKRIEVFQSVGCHVVSAIEHENVDDVSFEALKNKMSREKSIADVVYNRDIDD